MTTKKKAADVSEHYNATAATYSEQYRRESLFSSPDYPANYFRLQLLVNSFLKKGVKRVMEVGVGEGTPLAALAEAGIDPWGFDIAENMVLQARARLKGLGYGDERIFKGDIQDPMTYSHSCKAGLFDAVVAMGVMPHVQNDDLVLDNIASIVRPGGSVFIEFRNKLFSLFTFNRHTMQFFLDDLMAGVDPKLKSAVEKQLRPRLLMEEPPLREVVSGSGAAGFDAILAKFHNPLLMPSLFARHGFRDVNLLWYHYHPAMPFMEKQDPGLFRSEGMRLEHDPGGWRGMFLCSAFVVEAVKV